MKISDRRNGQCIWRFNIGTNDEPEFVTKTFNQHNWLKSQEPQKCSRCGVERKQ